MAEHCGYCGSRHHTTAYCPKTAQGQSNRRHLRCSYCGETDHNRDACTKAWPGPNPVRLID